MFRNPPQPGVRSVPLENGGIPAAMRPATGRPQSLPFRPDRIPLVVIGWLSGAIWWTIGARYTIDGLPLVINMMADFLHAPLRLASINDWHWYVALCWLPICFSWIEQRNRPRWGIAWSVIMVWAVVAGLDLASTWLAVTTQPGDWRIARQVAITPLLALAWTGVTTFIPERLMMSMWRLLRR